MAEYIEREALLKHSHIGMTRVSDTEWQKGYWDGVDDMAEYIREEPAADVAEVKHGEWISYGLRNPQCSLCRNYNIEKSRFCPKCGGRMDGEGE